MPLPDLAVFCTKAAVGGRPCITFPGGATVCSVFADARIPAPDELSNQLLGQCSAALAPLSPFFDTLDVLIAIENCIKAVESALGPPPDPSKLAKCFPQLAKAMAKVLRLVPQLSVPVLIGGMLDLIILNLQGYRAQLLTLIKKQLAILAAQLRAQKIGSVALMTATNCMQDDFDATLANMNANAAPLGRMVEVLNGLLELANLPQLPPIGSIGDDAVAAIAPLDAALSLLTNARKLFP